MKIEFLIDAVDADTFIHDYLSACGIENVKSYLDSGLADIQSTDVYSNIDFAADRLHRAIENKERVGIVQDVDVDGVCSATIAYQFMAANGVEPIVYFHTGKQHGVADLMSEIQKSNLDLLIIPDASATLDDSMTLKAANCDIVIADHHEIEFENPYAIVVNCMCSPQANKDASGTTVMAKVVERCCELYGYGKIDFGDLIALSLIADSRSMLSVENRAYLNLNFGDERSS